MSNLSLYHIEKEYQALASEIIEAGGELTPELETALAINKDSLQLRAVQFALIIKEQEGEVELVKKEISRLNALKASREKSNERLEAIIKAAMELYEVTEIRGENFKLSFRKSTSLKITDESKIPAYFKEKVPESWKPINADIKAALTKGETVEGAELVNNKNLQIR
jgi:Siphovirus Gp157